MDPAIDLRYITTKYFDSVNFNELNDRWIEEIIDNEFSDAEENSITLTVLFVNDPAQTLNKLSETCNLWCQKEIEDESRSVNMSDVNNSVAQEMLWSVLDEMDICVKHIQGLIYLLCSRATKSSASQEDMALGLGSARFYFNLLRVPGSGAYSVYHSSLFQLCINSFPVPDFTCDKDSSSLRQFEKLTTAYVSALFSLIPLLKDFHLGEDSNTIEFTIKKLVEITTCEVLKPINFSINYTELQEKELIRRNKPSFNASALAFQALSTIINSDLNGDKDQNYNVILSFLNKSILCYKARKSPTFSQKHLVVKDNAVRFMCYNLNSQEFCSEVTQIAIKRLCLGVCDKTEFRSTVSLAVIDLLLKLKDEHVNEMVQWFLLLIDSADTKDRVFALDLLGHLLSIVYQDTVNEKSSSLPECFKKDSFYACVIFAILTRCDDISPNARTKALAVLSQNMQCIFNFLDKTKDLSTFEVEDEDFDGDIDINGTHRYFWYNIGSFRGRLNEIAAILHRRIEDNNVTARKAALVALENLMVYDATYITAENLKFFDTAAKDGNIVVKKQMIQSLTTLLDTYFNKSEMQESWIKCIFPLIQDPETTVQAAALLALEKQILQKLFSTIQVNRDCAFTLLKLLSSDDFLAHQRYFLKAFSLWKGENKLKPQTVVHLEKYVETDFEDCVWFFISHFALYSPIPPKISQCCVERFEKLHGEYPFFMKYILKVLKHMFGSLPTDSLERVQNIICENLKSYTIPVEFIDIYVELLFKIHKSRKTQSEFDEFSKKVIKKCEEHLSKIKSEASFSDTPEILLPKYFCLIKEFCHFCSDNITPKIVSLLKTFSASEELPKAFSKILSPSLRAHAFAALGKICLQDEILAKDLLPVYAKQLKESKHSIIRNNVVVILIEMCKRYTSLADKYVPLICCCFKDKHFLIRYQTIVLIVNLLQEDYIKWKGPLFFCLLSSLIDKKEPIQELARYSLCQLLHDKKRSLFSELFIDSIFVFNHFPPPDNETVAKTVTQLERFAMSGENRREERMLLYRFLLDSMDMKERAYLVKAICEIIMNVAETVYPLNKTTECIVRDCFDILTSKEIRAYNIDIFDEMDEEKENEVSKPELDMRRVVIIEPIIPVIVSLRNGVTDSESDLMHDIILFLKELLQDFRDSLKDILATDKILLRQLELEIKNEAERERSEKKMEKELKDKNKQTSVEQLEHVAHTPLTLQGIQTMMKEVSRIAEAEESEQHQQENSKVSSFLQTPKPPPQTSMNTRRLQSSNSESENIASISHTSEGSPQPVTFNIATDNPTEANEIQRLASTPRLVLTKLPLTTNILNVSAIVPEPMNVDDSED